MQDVSRLHRCNECFDGHFKIRAVAHKHGRKINPPDLVSVPYISVCEAS